MVFGVRDEIFRVAIKSRTGEKSFTHDGRLGGSTTFCTSK